VQNQEQIMETLYSLGIIGLGVMGTAWRRTLRNGYPDWVCQDQKKD
jgi:hypothetical protein